MMHRSRKWIRYYFALVRGVFQQKTVSVVSTHMSHIRIRNICVTHGNVNVLRLRTTVRICNMWAS